MKKYLLIIIISTVFVSCGSKKENKLDSFDFGVEKFDEPFLYLPSKPELLVKSLEYTPSWFLTDTIYLTKTLELEFNEESIRSKSEIVLKVGDSLGNSIVGAQVYFNNIFAKDNQIKIATIAGQKQDLVVSLKLLPQFGEQSLEGGIFVISDEIDEVNERSANSTVTKFAEWKAKQKIGGTWLLWLIWIIIAIMILVLVFQVLKAIFVALIKLLSPSKNIRQEQNKTQKNKKKKQKQLTKDYFESIREAKGTQKGGRQIGKEVYRYLDKEIMVKEGDIYYHGDKIGYVTPKEIILTKKLDNDGVNKILNHAALMPNMTYIFTDRNVENKVTTDSLGRVSVYKALINSKVLESSRDNTKQTDALIFKDGEVNEPQTIGGERTDRYNDQGGHIVPHICGGSNCLVNIYPQAHQVNNSAEFKADEKKTREALFIHDQVELVTEFLYHDNSMRPSSIIRKHGFDGIAKEFVNRNLEKHN